VSPAKTRITFLGRVRFAGIAAEVGKFRRGCVAAIGSWACRDG
jgi:hypothetical protein